VSRKNKKRVGFTRREHAIGFAFTIKRGAQPAVNLYQGMMDIPESVEIVQQRTCYSPSSVLSIACWSIVWSRYNSKVTRIARMVVTVADARTGDSDAHKDTAESDDDDNKR
jgi:hypothetical protein